MPYPEVPNKQARKEEKDTCDRGKHVEQVMAAGSIEQIQERQVIDASERDDEGEESGHPFLIYIQWVLRHLSPAVCENIGYLQALNRPEAQSCRQHKDPREDEDPADYH
jgi:hypothetical protein